MSKRLVQVLYNPGSISSVGSNTPAPDEPMHSGSVLVSLKNTNANILLGLVESLRLDQYIEKESYQKLIRIKKQLMGPLDMATRVVFLQNFNGAISNLANRFGTHADLFQACVQVISMAKEIIEKEPQPFGTDSRQEWVNLEKAIYHLSQWEGQLEFYWSSVN